MHFFHTFQDGYIFKKTVKIVSVGKEAKEWESLQKAGGNVKWYSGCGKHSGSSSKSLTELSYDPAFSLSNIYSEEQKIGNQTNTCAQMFTAPLFTIAKIETTQQSSMDE